MRDSVHWILEAQDEDGRERIKEDAEFSILRMDCGHTRSGSIDFILFSGKEKGREGKSERWKNQNVLRSNQ